MNLQVFLDTEFVQLSIATYVLLGGILFNNVDKT